MRVLHLYAGNLYGGVERLLATAARARASVPAMEPAFALAWDARLADELRAAGCPPGILGGVRLSRPWTLLRARRRLARRLAAQRPDVAICHSAWSLAAFGPVARKRRVPLVFWLHDALAGEDAVERAARRIRPDAAIATSAFAGGTLPRLWRDLPADVVHPPVDTPPAEPGTRERVRAELGARPEDVVIAQASRMEPWKGHRTHLRALGLLRDVPGWTAWLAGGATRPHEAAHLAEMQRLAASLGIADRVRFLGARSDVPALLAAADVLCQPNAGPEPFGISYVEALAAGRPVVASALGGAREVVDGTCGLLVPPDDPAATADALLRLVRDGALRARLGAAGPARAAHLCDPARQLHRLHAVLAKTIRDRRAA